MSGVLMVTWRALVGSGVRSGLAAMVAVATMVAAGAVPAHAEFGPVPGSFLADTFEDDGATPVTQAASHPFSAATGFSLNTTVRPHPVSPLLPPITVPDGTVRDIVVDLPAGFVGNPRAVPRCPLSALKADSIDCPVDTQVGYATADFVSGLGNEVRSTFAVYNMEVDEDELARFGFNIGVAVRVDLELRTDGDYGVRARIRGINNLIMLRATRMTLWGVPAAAANDDQRCAVLNGEVDPPVCDGSGTLIGTPTRSGVPPKPLLTNPSSCGAAMTSTLELSSWAQPDVWKPASYTTASGVTGCDRVPFLPTMAVGGVGASPDSPTGLDLQLAFGQTGDNVDGLDVSPLRDATVTLPEGLTINPGSADGLQACDDAQLRLGSGDPVSCPPASRIGTVVAESPALERPMEGRVILRSQASDDPESGDLFRLALVLEGAGQLIKLPGSVAADSETGRLIATFRNNPQLPVSKLRFRLKDGARAPLATPRTCGTRSLEAQLVSWSGRVVGQSPTFDTACAPGLGEFGPSFEAGAENPVAGEFSPFLVRIAKPDGHSDVSRVGLDMPDGVLARLKGNLGTRVGTARVAAGPGSNPFWLSGPVVLEGPYGDAPYSLRVTVPAKAGPFDLGDVVVRQKVYVDRSTAKVKVVSDPLPTIVKGVPVRLQKLAVDIDKPGFALNPTSCARKEVGASLGAPTGQQAVVSSRFQVGECQTLSFKPRLALDLTGRGQVITGRHPGVRAVVKQSGIGEAAIGRAKVVLPSSVALDPENAQALCEFEDGTKPDLENHCPKGSVIGKATAKTPLLERPLSGEVFFVKRVERDPRTGASIRKLPMIVVALRGEIAVNLVGRSSTDERGRLVNTFAAVPDAPISRFDLSIDGGASGVLVVTRTRTSRINLCSRPDSHRATSRMTGHNGKQVRFATKVGTPCAKASRAEVLRGAKKRH